jgi:hypothetical protein
MALLVCDKAKICNSHCCICKKPHKHGWNCSDKPETCGLNPNLKVICKEVK